MKAAGAACFRLAITVQPGARRSEIVGWQADRLKVRVAAPPVEGAANRAVIELLATALRLPRSRFRIARGANSRLKAVEIAAAEADCRQRLTAAVEQLVDNKSGRD